MVTTRSRILVAACDLFAQHGIATTMEAVRLKAGVSSGSIRHFFPNIEVLARALFVQLHEARIGRMTDAFHHHPGRPAAGLAALLRGEVAFAAERPAQARVHQMLATTVWSEKVAPGIATWRAEQDDLFQSALGPLIGTSAGSRASLTALMVAIEGCASRLMAGVPGGVPAADMDKTAGDIGAALCKGFGIPFKAARRPDQTGRSGKASPQPDFFAEAAPPVPDAAPGR